MDLSGLWLVAVVIGPVLLALALGFAIHRWRSRRRANDTARNRATKALYKKEERREEDSGVEPSA